MASGLCPTIFPGSGAYEFVSAEYRAYTDRVRNLSTDAAADIAAMESFTPDFSSIPFEVDTTAFEAIDTPQLTLDDISAPSFAVPAPAFNTLPPELRAGLTIDDGSGILAVGPAPEPSFGDFESRIPAPPNITIPSAPSPAPEIDVSGAPDAVVVREIDLPNLGLVGAIGDAPDIILDEFDRDLPVFEQPSTELQDIYFADVTMQRGQISELLEQHAQGGARSLLAEMYLGGTGLPIPAQTAIMEAQYERQRQLGDAAIRQAERDWAARGFSLPGAAVQGARREAEFEAQQNMGRANRELAVEFYRERVNNVRFALEQGLGYEGQLMNIYLQLDSNARELANGHFEVMRSIYTVFTALYELQIRAYTAEINVFEANVRIALGRVDVYRAQIEAERTKAEVNAQLVNVYESQVRAELARVEVYKGQIEAYDSRIRAELGKVEAFKAKVDAFEAGVRGAVAEASLYDSQIRGETARAGAHEVQVRAYNARVEGFRARVEAEATKTRSINDVVKAEAEIYQSQVDAWAQGVNADTRRIEASVSRFRGEIEAYIAKLNTSETAARLEALGFEKELERAKLVVEQEVANIDRALRTLTTASTLELQKLSDAAKINAQLAASSMASLSLSASLSGSDSFSSSSSTSCSTSYSGVIV